MFGRFSQVLAAVVAVAAALPANAETPLTGAQFDALSSGRTLYYSTGGLEYGVEQYLPGRRVLWAFTQEDCMVGHWYEQGNLICFVYDREPDPQCWTFYATDQGLMARFQGDEAGQPLIALRESREPLACYGADLGV